MTSSGKPKRTQKDEEIPSYDDHRTACAPKNTDSSSETAIARRNASTQLSFWELATQPEVYKRASRLALIVGPVIGLINHGDKILNATMEFVDWSKFGLTFIVPYCVSTWSSVMALRERGENI